MQKESKLHSGLPSLNHLLRRDVGVAIDTWRHSAQSNSLRVARWNSHEGEKWSLSHFQDPSQNSPYYVIFECDKEVLIQL